MSHTHRLTRRSVRRGLTLSAAGALVFALLPGVAVGQESPEARDLDDGLCASPEAEFDDINNEEAQQAAGCLADLNIVEGFEDGDYGPSQSISREQMASFIARKLESADQYDVPADPAEADFPDRDEIAEVHVPNVDIIAAVGITDGRDDGSYGPKAAVNRGQMALFIVRQIEEMAGEEIATPTEDYFDDDDGSVYEDAINKLASLGIVVGTDDGDYDATASVTRGQMARFVARDVDALNEEYEVSFTAVGEEPTTNETFDVTPETAEVLEASASVLTNEGRRQYTVSNPVADATHTIALVDADNVTVTDNTVTFADEDADNEADGLGDTAANIELVNGDATDRADVQDAQAVDGQITFTVDSTTAADVIPIVYFDEDEEGDLDVDDTGAPTEAEVFGVGGETTWIPAEQPSQEDEDLTVDEPVTSVSKDDNYFTANNSTFYYSNDDVFSVVAGEAGTDATDACDIDNPNSSLSEFEDELSTDDHLDANSQYNQDEDGNSFFCLENLAPPAPTNVAAARTGDTTVLVTWDDLDGVDSFNVYRAEGEFGDVAFADGDFTMVGSVDSDTNADPEELEDTGLEPATTYTYVVTAVLDGDESAPDGDDADAQATTLTAGDTVAPVSADAQVINDAGVTAFENQGTVSTGDVWQVAFDEALAALDNGEVIRVEDGGGDTLDVACNDQGDDADAAGEADCDLNDGAVTIEGTEYGSNEVLTVSFWSAGAGSETNITGLGGAVLQYPVEITDATGFPDADDTEEWDPAGDPDTTLEVDEDADATEGAAATATANFDENSIIGAEVTVTLTDETYVATPAAGGFALNGAPTGVSVDSVNRDSDTVATLTLADDTAEDFDTDVTFTVTVNASELTGDTNLTTDEVTITAVVEPLLISASFTGADAQAGLNPPNDVLALDFDTTMDAPDNTDTLQVTDAGDNTTTLACGVEITCSVDAVDDSVINVTSAVAEALAAGDYTVADTSFSAGNVPAENLGDPFTVE